MRSAIPAGLIVAALMLAGCHPSPDAAVGQAPPPNVQVTSQRLPDPPAFPDICIAAQGERIPVIMYHDVIKRRGPGSVYFDVTAEEFESDMNWIKSQNAVPISLQELYDHLTTGKKVPHAAIVLTFDDNYQGYYDYALPILRKFNYPSAMFVHTAYVGDKTHGRPKMTWDELKEIVKDPLVTIGSHTVTHPADITKLSPDDQQKELTDSKAELEKELGKPMPFLAYPDGKNNQQVQDLAKAIGYKMAFSMHNQPAEESPNILCVGRYISTKTQKAWEDRTKSLDGGALGIYRHKMFEAPVAFREGKFAGVTMALVTGGTPVSLMSTTREGVLDFIRRTPDGVAGINGGFFAMAAIASTDNRMVGPCKTSDEPTVVVDNDSTRWQKLHNRPMVMWGPTEFAIAPYIPEQTLDPDTFLRFMPDMSDVFLTGVWLVHGGVARTKDQMDTFASKDIEDPRRRAFIGQMADGQVVIGASKDSATSAQFAKAIAEAGVEEAVLLDSGFSTSLVYGDKIMASGHSTPTEPSRPVPHAIVIKGLPDPASQAAALAAIPATDPLVVERTTHRHHHVASLKDAKLATTPVTAVPDAGNTPPDVEGPPVAKPPDATPPTTTPPSSNPPAGPPPPKPDPGNPPATTTGGTPPPATTTGGTPPTTTGGTTSAGSH